MSKFYISQNISFPVSFCLQSRVFFNILKINKKLKSAIAGDCLKDWAMLHVNNGTMNAVSFRDIILMFAYVKAHKVFTK